MHHRLASTNSVKVPLEIMHPDSSAQRTAEPVSQSIAPAPQRIARGAGSDASSTRRRVAVIGYYGNNNAGDEALLSSVLRHICASPRVAEVLVLSSKPESDGATAWSAFGRRTDPRDHQGSVGQDPGTQSAQLLSLHASRARLRHAHCRRRRFVLRPQGQQLRSIAVHERDPPVSGAGQGCLHHWCQFAAAASPEQQAHVQPRGAPSADARDHLPRPGVGRAVSCRARRADRQ